MEQKVEAKIPSKIKKFFTRLQLQRKSNPDEWDNKYRYVLNQVTLMTKKQLRRLRKLNSRVTEIGPSETMSDLISVYFALFKGEPLEANLIKSEYNSEFYWWLNPYFRDLNPSFRDLNPSFQDLNPSFQDLNPISQKGCYPPYFALNQNWIAWLTKIFPSSHIQLSPFSIHSYCSDG